VAEFLHPCLAENKGGIYSELARRGFVKEGGKTKKKKQRRATSTTPTLTRKRSDRSSICVINRFTLGKKKRGKALRKFHASPAPQKGDALHQFEGDKNMEGGVHFCAWPQTGAWHCRADKGRKKKASLRDLGVGTSDERRSARWNDVRRGRGVGTKHDDATDCPRHSAEERRRRARRRRFVTGAGKREADLSSLLLLLFERARRRGTEDKIAA